MAGILEMRVGLRKLDADFRAGGWEGLAPGVSPIHREVRGATLGIIGYGELGHGVARIAEAFGMRVIAHDPYVSELAISDAGVEPVSFGELLERSDYLSVHAPHNDA